MPGIVVNTSVRSGPSTVNQNPTATLFLVGRTERGPEGTAKLVGSLADYEIIYGDYIASGAVHQQVQTFFEEGGAQVYVSRVVGPSATFGDLDVTGGTAGTAMTLTAVGQGAWSSNLDAEVVTLGSGFNVRFYLNDALVYSTGEVANTAAAVQKINSSSVAANYATAEDGGDTLAVFVKAAFSAGDADEGNITDGDYTGALRTNFTDDLGPGAVAIPHDGSFADVGPIHEALIEHAAGNNRFALLAGNEDDTTTEIKAHGSAVTSADNAEYGAMFYPWVKMVNESGTTINMSPEGYVAAKRAQAHNSIGSWAAYAGSVSESKFITGLYTPINSETGDDLDDNKINALRVINGRVRVYGARTLSSDEDNFRFTTSREMLNYVVDRAKTVLEDLIFSPIDGRSSLFSKVEARLVNMLEPIRIAGGLYEAFDSTGRRIDYGYSVQVNDAINPLTQLAGGLVKAKVGIRVSSTSDQIQVDVTKSNLTASVV